MGDGSTSPGVSAPMVGPRTGPGLTIRLRRQAAGAVVRGLDHAAAWASRRFTSTPAPSRTDLSEAQIRSLVAASVALDREERRLIDEVILAGSRHVRELMVPRTEVIFLDAAMPIAGAVAVVQATRHSRFPVVEGSADDVVGFVHLRDLVLPPERAPVATVVGDLTREICRLPASKRLLAALSEMRRDGDHLALVVDEYGGTAGIVTLEDLIEELVGEIHDEYDVAPDPILADGAAPTEVDGLLNLSDFADRTTIVLPSGPYDTVGGFVMAALGRLPGLGDEVVVEAAGVRWLLTVSEMDGRRVARVALGVAASAGGAAVTAVAAQRPAGRTDVGPRPSLPTHDVTPAPPLTVASPAPAGVPEVLRQ